MEGYDKGMITYTMHANDNDIVEELRQIPGGSRKQ